MAASLAERLKLKQYQVDTWTTREQLCLASAVTRSGDQNWVAVRRNIKILTNESGRPQDWYSTKNCALQYTKLLETVDTPKRKRERGDGGNETPGEIVTKMLSKQRIEELRGLESEERASYTCLRNEIQQLEAGLLDNNLDALWDQLVKEQAEEEAEEQRQQQWLKEREEKITAIQQALKHQGPKMSMPPHKKKHKSHLSNLSGGAASGRRNSGVSETSSEVDSTVDSPDINEESLVSTKSQDEGGGGGSSVVGVGGSSSVGGGEGVSGVGGGSGGGSTSSSSSGVTGSGSSGSSSGVETVRPTPPSPLLTTLLSKLPLPGSQSGMRGVRSLGFSEALQNMVTTAISGTDSPDKHKTTHTSPSSGSSTLSRLLDLPPSTPGGPLPRISDLPGPTYHQREQDKKFDALRLSIKEPGGGGSCGETKGCGDGDKACSNKDSTGTPQTEDSKEESSKESPCKEEVKDKKDDDDDNTDTQQPKEETEEKPADQKPADQKPADQKTTEKEHSEETEEKKTSEETETDSKTEEEKPKEETSKSEPEVNDEDSLGDLSDFPSKILEKEEKTETPDTVKTDEGADVEADKPKETIAKKVIKDVYDNIDEDEMLLGDPKTTSSRISKEDLDKEKKVFQDDLAKIHQLDDPGLSLEMEKKPRKTYSKRDQEEDQDSKDWISEEESSSTSSRRRKVSGGDLLLGCSSPLVTESAPTSPASTHYGDDSESEKAYRSWKRPIMILWNEIAAHKYASLFLRPITDEKAPGYHSVVYRAMDLQKIKRNIESGVIRTTGEFQRDMMLMFLNATMYNTRDHNVYTMAHQMMKDAVATIEDFLNTQMLARAEDTPQKSLRRETRESSAKRTDDDPKRKRDSQDDKGLKKRRL